MKFPDWLPVYGDTDYRGDCPQEGAEQATFFARVRNKHPEGAGRVATHIKNEGKRRPGQVRFDRAQGMTAGAADVIIPGAPAFVCEIKRRDHTKSRWQDGQVDYLETAQKMGAFVCVALGADAAEQALNDWLKQCAPAA